MVLQVINIALFGILAVILFICYKIYKYLITEIKTLSGKLSNVYTNIIYVKDIINDVGIDIINIKAGLKNINKPKSACNSCHCKKAKNYTNDKVNYHTKLKSACDKQFKDNSNRYNPDNKIK